MKRGHLSLGVREREIMEALYRLGEASVAEVKQELSGEPHYSTVRTMLNKLEGKGQLTHSVDGPRFVYRPVATRPDAQRTTMKTVLSGLFDGSVDRAFAALAEVSDDLSAKDMARIQVLIDKLREEGR